MKLTIPAVPPSLNKVLRMHWTRKRKLNAEWQLWVLLNLPEVYLKPFVKMRCSVTLAHSRAYDHDNAFGAVKPVIDALRAHQAIFEDSPAYLALEVVQTKCPHKQRHTIIELEPA